KCNIALVGIGNVDEGSTLYKHKFLGKDEKDLIKSKGGVVDICFIPFNINGEIVETEISNRIIGIDATSLIDIPLVIGVAGGEEKKNTVLGALKSGLLNVIITDSDTASYVLESMHN
ncbi:MAG: RNA polymerase subunit sigma-70, partial [Clostridiaceae bacterium]|nr:RNA polymerase subunit sigma-70 [Clostridiaceae bacterium]